MRAASPIFICPPHGPPLQLSVHASRLGRAPQCDNCVSFKSRQALSVHLARLHGVRVDIRRWVSSSVCVVCMVDFGTRPRCIAHLAYRSALCKINIVLAVDPLSDEAVMELDTADTMAARSLRSAGRRPNFTSVACRRVYGPLPAVVPLPSTDVPARYTAHHPQGVGRHRHAP